MTKKSTAKRARKPTAAERAKQQAGAQLADAARSLTVVEAAAKGDVHPETVKRWIASGKLQAFKYGGHWRIRPQQIEEFLRAQGAV
jgi:excisionase family DNA binding protein